MNQAYLNRAANDILTRATTILLNDTDQLSIKNASVNRNIVVIEAVGITSVFKVTSIKLIDEVGNIITERITNIDFVPDKYLEFRFEFEINGGV